MRYKVTEIAPAVDKVLGEQFKNMLQPFTSVGGEETKADGFSLDVEKLEDPKAEPEAAGPPDPDPK
jgi:hypothetical protein